MEAINQIKKEFHPTVKNENETLTAELWNITTAEANAPGKTNPIILTPAIWEQYYNGEEIPELTQAIESLTESYCHDYFYYNNLELINNDLKIELTHTWKGQDIFNNLNIECKPEYNPLLERMEEDAFYYYNIEASYWRTPEEETIDFLTYHIMEEYIETSNIKDHITTKDILTVLKTEYPDYRELLRQVNYTELFKDITQAYNKLITDIKEEVEEAIQDKYYDEVYYPNQEYATNYIIEEYTGTPLKDVI